MPHVLRVQRLLALPAQPLWQVSNLLCKWVQGAVSEVLLLQVLLRLQSSPLQQCQSTLLVVQPSPW